MANATAEGLLTVQQVAVLLQVSPWTLYRWRYEGTGPTSLRVGGLVRYRKSDIETWLTEREKCG